MCGSLTRTVYLETCVLNQYNALCIWRRLFCINTTKSLLPLELHTCFPTCSIDNIWASSYTGISMYIQRTSMNMHTNTAHRDMQTSGLVYTEAYLREWENLNQGICIGSRVAWHHDEINENFQYAQAIQPCIFLGETATAMICRIMSCSHVTLFCV